MKQTQGGMTLLEMLGALAVGTVLLIGLVGMIDVSLEDARGSQAAHHQAQLYAAAQKYIAANYASLVTDTASAVVPVTVTQLKNGNYLSNNFADTNSYLQQACVLVRQPDPGKLDALVVTYGGTAIPDRNIASVAMSAGQGGGYIASMNTSVARGASWSADTTPYRSVACDGTTALTGGAADGGHLVSNLFYDGPGQLASDFIYRDSVAGRPELNRMNTPLQMASAALVTNGTACGSEPAMALDSTTRRLLVCDSNGLWTNASSWKEPVASYATLPASGNSLGDVRMINDLGRAFTWNGSAWRALAVDQNGNLIVPRNVDALRLYADYLEIWSSTRLWGDTRATDLYVYEDVQADGWVTGNDMVAWENIWVSNQFSVAGNSVFNGDVDVAGGVTAAFYAPVLTGTPGGSCPTYLLGTTMIDANGLLLSCHSTNTWRYQRGTTTP